MTLQSPDLAQALLAAVRAQRLADSADALLGGSPMRRPPSVDLAAVAFTPAGPVGANVLFSREHPQGHVAAFDATGTTPFGPLHGLRFDADLQDAAGVSIAWQPDTDWAALPLQPLWGAGPVRFVAPYPASLLKLMVAVGMARCVDAGLCGWHDLFEFDARSRRLSDWQFDMLAVSCNTATSALVALLHRCGALGANNALHTLFAQLGLPTLRLANTRPDGGWGNAAGAGVGHIQMTAWDTVRLLWWLDPAAPPCPWLAPGAPRLTDTSRAEVLRGLQGQGLDIVLSSGALAGLDGWVPGLPAQVQPGWLQADGRWVAGDYSFPSAATARTEAVRFAHKIGNTENYTADAGIVIGLGTAKRHYLIALLSNLGQRYAPHPLAACPWGLPALGAAIDQFLAARLE